MKPHPRIRKTIKWGGAAVTVLLIAVWIGSGFITVRRITENMVYFMGGGDFGALWLVGLDGPVEPAWTFEHANFRIRLAPNWDWSSAYRGVQIPFWALVGPSLMVTGFAWRLDTLARRRAKLNLCPKCGYDRTGIATSAACPECGAVPASA